MSKYNVRDSIGLDSITSITINIILFHYFKVIDKTNKIK